MRRTEFVNFAPDAKQRFHKRLFRMHKAYPLWTKRRLNQRAGISQYWIVDLDARIIERWHPEDDRPEILMDQIYLEARQWRRRC
jgi:hypothetical protein